MALQTDDKLKWLRDDLPPGYLVDAATLEQHGVSRQLAYWYLKNGWLEPVARGVYRRPSVRAGGRLLDTADWRTDVASLHRLMGYKSHVGGRTALAEHGFEHYLSLGSGGRVYLYGDDHPSWLKRLPDKDRYVLRGLQSFGGDTDAGLHEAKSGMRLSTPERAILELLDELPRHESFHVADTVFEGLSNLRPRLLSALLTHCRSVKAKRYFFVLADRHNHGWRRHLDPAEFDLGTGPRALPGGGRYVPRYNVYVPEELVAADRSDADGA